jgi:hypothetical protein
VPDLLIVNPQRFAEGNRQGRPYAGYQLLVGLIHADNLPLGVVRTAINLKNVFHGCYELGVVLWGDLVVFLEMRSSFVFFSVL